ncbi:geranylgeranylglyceryl/heptaprenylglyceryl phosphate synthase [Candidatus Poribacteria bacterium]|nr:geranylgeranylglyceryl/heptaprenylglyceryl phosphate synthase [Candidatus Poribacteria bacterium]
MSEKPALWARLQSILDERGAGYVVLVDPDRVLNADIRVLAENAMRAGVDAFLVGGSLLMSDRLDATVKGLREASPLPTILFPGASSQLSRHADGLLFLSLVSGRNPDYLIGEHVRAAPIVRDYGLEAIPTGYMLIDGGTCSSVQFMSGTQPIPRDKSDIAIAHALASAYLGLRILYLEAGSGARFPVPDEMIRRVDESVSLPIIVGGGISKPEDAGSRVVAGASFIVTGTALERDPRGSLMGELSDAVHAAARARRRRLSPDA